MPATELFFALIRHSIGNCDFPYRPTPELWNEIFEIAKKQALVGITFSGIEKLPKEQHPDKFTLLDWYRVTEEIKKKNKELSKKCQDISNIFNSCGFRNCILKGQGIAQLYPNPTLRAPGDIDIWLEGNSKDIIQYVKRYHPKEKPVYHHINFPLKSGCKLEVHLKPSWMHNPVKNRRLQRFFNDTAGTQFTNIIETPEGSFPAPTLAFNRVYILLHIYRHLFQEGIGLRQLLDYYFVLKKGFTENEKRETIRILKSLGLMRFTASVMFIMQEIFHLDKSHMLTPPDYQRGQFLLHEIMTAGNFGMYDNRYSIVSKKNEFRHFINGMHRTLRLTRQYPEEVLWSPYFKIWHFFWRKRH